jgi:hypothetical protein
MVLTQTAEGVFVATEIRNGFPTLLSESPFLQTAANAVK